MPYFRPSLLPQMRSSLDFRSKIGPTLALCGLSVYLTGCAPDINHKNSRELLNEAWQDYHLSDFDRANNLFQRVETSSSEAQPEYVESLFGQASIWNTRQDDRDPARADALYAKIEQLDPRGPMGAWAMLDRVRVQHLRRADEPLDYQELARSYREVRQNYPGSAAGDEGYLQALAIEEINATPSQQRSLLNEYQPFLAQHPQSVYRGPIYAAMARLFGKLGQPQEKLSALLSSLEFREIDKGNPNELLVWNYWEIAVTAEFDAGNFAVARDYYRRIIQEYPSDLLVFRCQQALKRMDFVESELRAGRKIPANLSQPANAAEARL
jgi:tetratricopeptide (TPR) repeat protein